MFFSLFIHPITFERKSVNKLYYNTHETRRLVVASPNPTLRSKFVSSLSPEYQKPSVFGGIHPISHRTEEKIVSERW